MPSTDPRIGPWAMFSTGRRAPWRAWLPLAAYIAAVAGICTWLERTDTVAFSYRWPFCLLGLLPWVWWVWLVGRNSLSPFRSGVAVCLRLLLFTLLVVTLTEPRLEQKDRRLSVVYAIDLSGSVAPQAIESARKFVGRNLDGKPADDLAGVVYFGRNAAIQLPPKQTWSAADLGLNEVRIAGDGSNLADALLLSAAILPESGNGRIVLISDGVETDGRIASKIAELKSRKIAVDVLPVGYEYNDEMWLERIDLPPFVEEGRTYEAGVLVSSLNDGRAVLTIEENGRNLLKQEVSFPAGKSRFVVPFKLREPGFYEYVARLAPVTQDHIPQNNVAIGSVFLEGRGRILVVADPEADALECDAMISALKRGQFLVEKISPYDLSANALALKVQDAIIFVNVARDHFDQVQIDAVHDAIYHEGVGFLMVGGRHSFGAGGWGTTLVEQALPVSMDLTQRKVMYNGAIVLVLDHSGSMGGEVPGAGTSKLQLAKQAAIGTLDVLQSRDYLGIATFDTQATWVVPFGLNSAPDVAKQGIRGIGVGGGTDMHPALEQALDALIELPQGEAAARHIVLLTDGQSQGNALNFIRRAQAARVTVSTIGLGGPGEIDIAILKAIANDCQGRFYHAVNPLTLPRILMHEVITIRRNVVREEPMLPTLLTDSVVLKGIAGVPEIQALVVTVPKPAAELVLVAPPSKAEDPEDPVLVLGRHGIGRTAAFTSDLSPDWGREWIGWSQYDPFVQQLATEISRTQGDTSLVMESHAVGHEALVSVEDRGREPQSLRLRAIVNRPDGKTQELPIQQVAARRYEARFPLDAEGRYLVAAVSNRNDRLTGGFVVPYSQEYLRFTARPRVLEELARQTGGRVLTGEEEAGDIYSLERKINVQSQSIVITLLQLLAIAIPLDVGLRRIQFDWSGWRRWFFQQPAELTPTLKQLLTNKQAAAKATTRRELEPQPVASPPRPHPRPTPAADNPAREAPAMRDREPRSAEETSTTSRLLNAKRRSWQTREPDADL